MSVGVLDLDVDSVCFSTTVLSLFTLGMYRRLAIGLQCFVLNYEVEDLKFMIGLTQPMAYFTCN